MTTTTHIPWWHRLTFILTSKFQSAFSESHLANTEVSRTIVRLDNCPAETGKITICYLNPHPVCTGEETYFRFVISSQTHWEMKITRCHVTQTKRANKQRRWSSTPLLQSFTLLYWRDCNRWYVVRRRCFPLSQCINHDSYSSVPFVPDRLLRFRL